MELQLGLSLSSLGEPLLDRDLIAFDADCKVGCGSGGSGGSGSATESRRDASIKTVALVWALTGVHFGLVVVAAASSTWHFSLPAPLALGGGVVLMGVGAVLCVGAAYAFRSPRRLNFLEHTRLVTEGIYRWSRNPQLVGWTLVLVGLGLLRGSAMVLFLAGLVWVSYRLHLPTEEEHLRRVFGDDYEAYQRRTHRYFGPPRQDAAE